MIPVLHIVNCNEKNISSCLLVALLCTTDVAKRLITGSADGEVRRSRPSQPSSSAQWDGQVFVV